MDTTKLSNSVCVTVLFMGMHLFSGVIDTDPAHKYAWSENTGWLNAAPTNAEVAVHYYEGSGGWLSGFLWAENMGWINVGSSGGGPYANTTSNNWGVNVAADGGLSGYAWGENIGWINFGAVKCDAAIDPSTGEFSGHAWAENIGWMKFQGVSPDYGVRSMAFYTQSQGTPNWWLDYHAVNENYDAGDGVLAWQKYVMDTDPNVDGDYLHITIVSNGMEQTDISFTPASTRRYYTLQYRQDLNDGAWGKVSGEDAVQFGSAGEQAMQHTNDFLRKYYRIYVSVEP